MLSSNTIHVLNEGSMHELVPSLRSVLVFMLLALPVAVFGEGVATSPFHHTGSDRVSDLELILMTSDNVMPEIPSYSEEVEAREREMSITVLSVDESQEPGNVLFVDFGGSRGDQFTIRIMNEVAPKSRLIVSSKKLYEGQDNDLSAEGKALQVTFENAFSCGSWFTFRRNGQQWQVTEGRKWNDEESTAPVLVKDIGGFVLGDTGQTIYAYSATGPDDSGLDFILPAVGVMLKKSQVGSEDDAEVSCPDDAQLSQLILIDPEAAEAESSDKAPPTSCGANNGQFVPNDFCDNCNSCPVTVFDNPDATSDCNNTKLLLILDESGSINSTEGAEVATAVNSLMSNLNCKGVSIMIMEFAAGANYVLDKAGGYKPVNNNIVDAVQDYFNGNSDNDLAQSNNAEYRDGSLGSTTNYQSAFLNAYDFKQSFGAPDIILFFTDGVPNRYYTTGSSLPSYTSTSVNSCSSGTSYNNAAIISNHFKCLGTHVFTAAVTGSGITTAIQAVSGPTAYMDGTNTLLTADYSLGNFSDLTADFTAFVNQLCTSANLCKRCRPLSG